MKKVSKQAVAVYDETNKTTLNPSEQNDRAAT